jgi:arylsulfatase A-like enzyme
VKLNVFSIIVLLAAFLPSVTRAAEGSSRKPNIIVIVSDDQGWNTTGYHNGFVKTPNIDRIAAQGVQLDRFYVSPMCSPTREGLATGRYPMRFGMGRSVVRPWAKWGLPPAERTLAEALGDAGYQNRGAFGKWHMGHLEQKWHPLSQGFTAFKGVYNGAADYWTRDRDGEIDWHHDRTPSDDKGYTTNLIAEAASDFVTAHAKENSPFFAYVPFSAPHDPFQAPDEYVKRYANLDDTPGDGKPSDKQLYAAMIACLDDGIGKILDAVQKAGVAGNTLVWFLADNGGILKIAENNKPLREGKLTVYEGGVRTLSAVWWPGHIDGGRKIDAPIMNIDLLPTLVSIAGGKADGGAPLDGVDCSQALLGKSDQPPPRDLYFFTGQGGLQNEQIAVTQPDGWKLIVIGPDVRKGIKPGDHKIELFNVQQDPGESKDQAKEKPELVDQLSKKLVDFRASEPAKSLPPLNKKPADFKPPKHWEPTEK